MPYHKLTEAAKKDLRGISAYTKKTWGKEQEKAYREAIRAALRVIAKTPKIRFWGNLMRNKSEITS